MISKEKKKKKCPKLAFAHTISSELTKKGNMTAWVAMLFRKTFGRPKFSDCVDSKLAYQKAKVGASIYRLMTKPVYFGKPTD